MTSRTIHLGKIDYNHSGRRNCLAEIEISWDGKRFSATAGIWNPRKTDYYMCGQALEEVAAYFPRDKRAQRILAIWRDWHLNDMKAGSPAQEAWLKANPIEAKYPESHYDKASAALAGAGINPDPSHIHNGTPYKYGSAWLHADVPAEIVAEIEALLEGTA